MKTILDFEDLHREEFVENQYSSEGIIFDGESVFDLPGVAHSGKNYLEPWRMEFSPVANFSATFLPLPQERVALYAGTEKDLGPGTSAFGILHAYAFDGTPIIEDGPKSIEQGHCGTRFEVMTPNSKNQIYSVVLDIFAFDADGIASNPDQAVDDLEFESLARWFPIPRSVLKDPRYLYDPWWWIKTHWGLIDPSGPLWARAFVAARDLAALSRTVDRDLHAGVLEVAKKQGLAALAQMRREVEARPR
jgi:hypothetical protein